MRRPPLDIYEAGLTFFASGIGGSEPPIGMRTRSDSGEDDNHIVQVGLIREF